jgi:hypothetical protein
VVNFLFFTVFFKKKHPSIEAKQLLRPIYRAEDFMRNIQFAPDDDIIEICRDNVFKATFTRDDPRSQGALKRLISAYIGRDVETVTVIANEPGRSRFAASPRSLRYAQTPVISSIEFCAAKLQAQTRSVWARYTGEARQGRACQRGDDHLPTELRAHQA